MGHDVCGSLRPVRERLWRTRLLGGAPEGRFLAPLSRLWRVLPVGEKVDALRASFGLSVGEGGREEGLEKGREKGLEKGREEGRFQTYAAIIYKHIVKHECSVHEAMEFFEIPQNDAAGVFKLVNEEMSKQAAMKQQATQYAIHAKHLQSKAEPIQKYIKKRDVIWMMPLISLKFLRKIETPWRNG